MSHRTIGCAFASLISALALLFVPASSFAESPSECTKICVENTQAVEVTAQELGYSTKWLTAPLLPHQAGTDSRRLEHEYFQRLYGIASSMCTAVGYPYEGLYTSTGFTVQLVEFNVIRQLLNKLLQRYGLGFAPDLEDFSHIQGLDYILSPERLKERNGHTERISSDEEESGNTAYCTFKLTSSMR